MRNIFSLNSTLAYALDYGKENIYSFFLSKLVHLLITCLLDGDTSVTRQGYPFIHLLVFLSEEKYNMARKLVCIFTRFCLNGMCLH